MSDQHAVSPGREPVAPDELMAVLAEETPDGRNARFVAEERLGRVSAYLQELEHARQQAARQFAAAGPPAGPALALQVRCALVASSLYSLPAVVPPALLCALVSAGIWSPAQGLAVAGRIPDGPLRGEALVRLAGALDLQAGMTSELVAAALALTDEQQRARALVTLHLRLPDKALDRVLDGIRCLSAPSLRVRALVELAAHLPTEALPQLLVEATALDDPVCRVEAVAGLAPQLPAELMPGALSAILDLADEPLRAGGIGCLAPHLPAALCRQALAGTWRMRDAAARSEAQARLAAYLPASWRAKALAAALDGLAQVHHSRVPPLLAVMAPHLPDGLQERAMSLAEALPDSHARLTALAVLLPHLSAERREQAAGLALRSVLLIRSDAGRAEATARLAPYLPAGLRRSALTLALSLAGGPARAAALSALAPCLDRPVAGDVLTAALSIADDRSCATALAGLAPLLDSAQQALVLLRAGSLVDEKARATLLVGLAPLLEAGLLPRALDGALRLSDARALAAALVGLAPAFDEPRRGGILDAAAAISDPALRFEALAGLLPSLSPRQQAVALNLGQLAVNSLTDEPARVDALCRLAPHLAPGCEPQDDPLRAERARLLAQALAGLPAIQDAGLRCRALRALAPQLAPQLLDAALAALPLSDEASAAGLLALIPHLPAGRWRQVTGRVLVAARCLPPPARSRVVDALVPYLEAEQLGEALAVARLIGDVKEQAEAGLALGAGLDETGCREILETVRQAVPPWKQAAVLSALARRLPEQLRAAAGLMAAKATTEAAPAPTLADAGGATAAPARPDEDACHRAEALACLLPDLPAEERPDVAAEVLGIVRTCRGSEGAGRLDWALAAVAPFLAAEQVPFALVQARRLAAPCLWSRHRQATALAALVRRLPERALRSELAAAFAIGDLHLRAQTLTAVAEGLAELGLDQEALSAVRPIEPLAYQVDALLRLAPHLSLAWLREAAAMACELGRHAAPAAAAMAVRLAELGAREEGWRVALDIPVPSWQAEALAGVARYLPPERRLEAYNQAIGAARALALPAERLATQARLARRLPGELQLIALRDALRSALEAKAEESTDPSGAGKGPRGSPLAPLADILADLCSGADDSTQAALREIWLAGGLGEKLLQALGRQQRHTTLLELAILAPLLGCLGGGAALAEASRAVRLVTRWWP